ncbi:polysaccharide deacetylase family protein [Streptococcus cuniculipharyngis]|uniref:Polysaccharide deacetylase family protein n=1 Tax=Streptococcus cuniculipharyngis TaxID=1562651 RepID=A0A5C5SFG9_9STRE|nr:polysaccharide deacetylase family protein [Streptococcus cuniculipharyngis]TWS98701.1 polysaccharide deacetylase family protein [Streptococcus cuniculipharyngis]
MKKYLDLALVVSISLLLGLLLWNSVFNWVVQLSVAHAVNAEKKISQKSVNIKVVDQTNGKVNPVYYLSPTEKGTPVYENMVLAPKAIPTDKKNPKITVVYPTATDTSLKGVKQLEIHQVTYDKGPFGVKNRSDKIINSMRVKGDSSPFSLGHLFKDNGNGMERLEEELAVLYPEQEIKVSQSDDFDYQKGNLILADGVKVPLKNLYDVINSEYLQDKDLEAYQQYLRENKIFTEKVVALTLDDGPKSETTAQALAILEDYKVKATFYLVGQNIAGNENLLKQMKKAGHEIGNHSWDHSDLSKMSLDQVKASLGATSDAVKEVLGQGTKTMRPPYGASNDIVRAATALPPVMWTVDTYDWQNKNPDMILQNVKEGLQPGSVILMHDIHQSTIDALPAVLDYLISQGYKFVTISELYGY